MTDGWIYSFGTIARLSLDSEELRPQVTPIGLSKGLLK
jgi:hypothetical protein